MYRPGPEVVAPIEPVVDSDGVAYITEDLSINKFENIYDYVLAEGVEMTVAQDFSYSYADKQQAFSISFGDIESEGKYYARVLGQKQYELKDHLGNVRVVVSDRKLLEDRNKDGEPEVRAEVLASYNYYPFGMQQPGRTYEGSAEYRFGFNGKEKDNSLGSTVYDYGFRIYNPQIGKFLSVDPLTKSYPMLTPYQFASNTPIQAVDLDGLEAYHFHSLGMYNKFTTMIDGKSEAEIEEIAYDMWSGVNDWVSKQDKLISMENGWGENTWYNLAITRDEGGPFSAFAPGDNAPSVNHAIDKMALIREGEWRNKQEAYKAAIFRMQEGIIGDQNERERNRKVIYGVAAIEGALFSGGGTLYAASAGGALEATAVTSLLFDGANVGIALDDMFENVATKNLNQEFYGAFKAGLSLYGISTSAKNIVGGERGTTLLNLYNDFKSLFDSGVNNHETRNDNELQKTK